MEERTTSPPATDAQLVERVKRGDLQVYGELVERYEREVLAIVLPLIRDVHDAQDVVQDIFVRCYLKLGALRDGSLFEYWLLKVAHREAIRASRRRRRDKSTLLQISDARGTQPSANNRLFNDEAEKLLDCVKRLPAHERQVVSMRFFDGRGVDEIAQITGRPLGTVTKQLSRAMARLRAEYDPEVLPCQTKESTKH